MELTSEKTCCSAGNNQVDEQAPCSSREDTLEEEIATHSSFLAWGILWTEEPAGLQSMVL